MSESTELEHLPEPTEPGALQELGVPEPINATTNPVVTDMSDRHELNILNIFNDE